MDIDAILTQSGITFEKLTELSGQIMGWRVKDFEQKRVATVEAISQCENQLALLEYYHETVTNFKKKQGLKSKKGNDKHRRHVRYEKDVVANQYKAGNTPGPLAEAAAQFSTDKDKPGTSATYDSIEYTGTNSF